MQDLSFFENIENVDHFLPFDIYLTISVHSVPMPSQKRRQSSGSSQRSIRACCFPPGPKSVEDLAAWPLSIAESLTKFCPNDKEVELRLKSHACNGLNVYTDYSGIDCPRECFRLGFAALGKLHGWTFRNPVSHSRSSDSDAFCRQVLLYMAADDSGCVFGNILDRLPIWASEWISAAMPPPDASLDDKRYAHGCISEWITQHADKLFADDAKSWCYAHERMCPSHPVLARELLQSFFPRPLMICCAGVSCLPWTAEGSNEGQASDCEIPHSIWMNERKIRASRCQEDIAFVECTPRYPIHDVFQSHFQDTHFCIWTKLGPELFGWPHKRMRVVGAALNLKTVEWHGPADLHEVQKDFSNRFHKVIELSGDIFALASDEERLSEYCEYALKQKNHLSPEKIGLTEKAELLRLLLPPGGVQRFYEWLECSSASGGGGSFMFDLDHHPNSKGSSGGSDWPVNLRHGTVMTVQDHDADSWQLRTTFEHFAAMGFLVFPELCKHFDGYPLKSFLQTFSSSQLKRFLGNGMHLVTQCAWMFYVLGNTSLIDRRQGSEKATADPSFME